MVPVGALTINAGGAAGAVGAACAGLSSAITRARCAGTGAKTAAQRMSMTEVKMDMRLRFIRLIILRLSTPRFYTRCRNEVRASLLVVIAKLILHLSLTRTGASIKRSIHSGDRGLQTSCP